MNKIDWKNVDEVKEYYHQNYLKNKKRKNEQSHQYYINNKEKCNNASSLWRVNNQEKAKAIQKKYRDTHKDVIEKWKKENPQYLRATNLVQIYKRNDKNANRGECTLSPQWIIDNIFTQPCIYCKRIEGWDKIGCDRKDSSLPHTPDNVVPCCQHCNCKKGTKSYEEFMLYGQIEN